MIHWWRCPEASASAIRSEDHGFESRCGRRLLAGDRDCEYKPGEQGTVFSVTPVLTNTAIKACLLNGVE